MFQPEYHALPMLSVCPAHLTAIDSVALIIYHLRGKNSESLRRPTKVSQDFSLRHIGSAQQRADCYITFEVLERGLDI
jgi:hypothetical protein